MTDKNNDLIKYGIAAIGFVGVFWLASNNAKVSNDTNVEAQAESVINLPATNEKLEGAINTQIRDEEKRSDEINRREEEMRNEQNQLRKYQDEKIEANLERIERIEDMLFELVKDK